MLGSLVFKIVINNISKDPSLINICCCDDWTVRRENIKKIMDESLLCKICCNSHYVDMIFHAISRIKSEEKFIEIVYSSTMPYARRMAVKKIRNKEVLMDLSLNDEDEEIRRIASKHI